LIPARRQLPREILIWNQDQIRCYSFFWCKNQMAAELLDAAAERNLTRLDESLFLELFAQTASKPHGSKSQQPATSL